MSTEFWKRYTPTDRQPWNARRAKHLHRRLGFHATVDEIDRDVSDGPEPSVQRFLAGADRRLNEQTESLARQSIDGNDIRLLKAAWVMQMWHGNDPLTEQLVLMWHNHFATSFLKVQDCDAMWLQNQLFRTLGRGSFRTLIRAILTDRAMLIWLDATSNVAAHPNENLARELLELFTLGVGNYSEDDVQETARALTGWRIDDDGIRFDESLHDPGRKTILGSTADHHIDSLADLIGDHPATARRLAWRICNHFFATPMPPAAMDELTEHLRDSRLNIESAVQRVIGSERFFSDAEIERRVSSPVSFVVGGVRQRKLHVASRARAAVSPEIAADWMAVMGQDLFQPSGVAGWRGGVAWLGTAAIIQRAAFAHALAEGRLQSDGRPELSARSLATIQAQLD